MGGNCTAADFLTIITAFLFITKENQGFIQIVNYVILTVFLFLIEFFTFFGINPFDTFFFVF